MNETEIDVIREGFSLLESALQKLSTVKASTPEMSLLVSLVNNLFKFAEYLIEKHESKVQ